MVAIVTGPVGGGKTTFLKSVVPRFPARGIACDGYLSERIMDGGKVAGYDLLDLRRGGRLPFLRRGGPPEGEVVGPYVMQPDGLAAAGRIIRRCAPDDWLVLDELGRLELAGKGVWPAAHPALADRKRPSLVVIRETLLESYLSGPLADQPVRVFKCAPAADPEAFLRDVSAFLSPGNREANKS